MVIKNQVLSIIEQIDEPQKVTIHKFIAGWIEECKRSGWHLQKALSRLDDDEKIGDWAYDENDDLISEKIDMIARVWLAYPNITVEQEKLYTVEIPDPNSIWKYTFLTNRGPGVSIDRTNGDFRKDDSENQLTESEIKKDFDFLWQFAKEVE